ncbi:MAG: 50S ribosomal protein L29 [Candidatus Portnoybacteria bacterium RBG_13_40_8]|uniref:Large ribosomal subunit protein uL29 n=1 Tax=Candidatus Portnoybacteria bacterium RBG_13_40_8 TaxID=1801990 RepID=A0A1G2F5Q1_9BACT|nr:MAG: 50S ribosomal protein L29 [Candidatus Portnoybacteria bacterium RBG_13_40_8]
MKIRELRQRPRKELKENLVSLKDKLRELRFNLAGGKVKNIKEVHQTKKTIARILTLIKEDEQSKQSK